MKRGLIMMLSKKKAKIIAGIMLLFAIGFFLFAVTHPTASFPWSNEITYFIYIVYVLVMVVLLIAPNKKKKDS